MVKGSSTSSVCRDTPSVIDRTNAYSPGGAPCNGKSMRRERDPSGAGAIGVESRLARVEPSARRTEPPAITFGAPLWPSRAAP